MGKALGADLRGDVVSDWEAGGRGMASCWRSVQGMAKRVVGLHGGGEGTREGADVHKGQLK